LFNQLRVDCAGLVHTWAAIVMGIFAGCVPWFTMMVLHKKSALLQKVDDTLAVFHTHAVAGILGGVLTGLLAVSELSSFDLPVGEKGTFYGGGISQLFKQIVGALFIIAWNIFSTTVILLTIALFIPLRMPDEQLMIGDDAVHGEEAYALWGDGDKFDAMRHETITSNTAGDEDNVQLQLSMMSARGVTIQL
jgi:ammonium transporter, Amt family